MASRFLREGPSASFALRSGTPRECREGHYARQLHSQLARSRGQEVARRLRVGPAGFK